MSDEDPQDLQQLLALQATDLRLAKVAHTLTELPEQQALEDARLRDRQLEQDADGRRVELERVEAEQRKHDKEIDQLRARLEAEQVRMYGGEVTNARELKSLEAEIDSVQRRIDQHEESLLEAMEAGEVLETTLADLGEQRAELASEIERLETARDDAAAALLAEQAELQVERDRQREALPSSLLDRYDDVRARAGGGVAVGELEGVTCTACRMELPMVEARELRQGPPLATCPQCRRLLVIG